MHVQEIPFTLKDGRKAVIRSPRDEDIPGMLEFLRASAGETDFLLRCPEECDQYTAEGQKALFDRVNSSENETMLVCIAEGKLTGSCTIRWQDRIKIRHRAYIVIALLKDYWNQGIGTKLFEEMLRIARENPGIIQAELGFVEGNSRARALYEKMGFRIVGLNPNAFRMRDGTLRHEYTMIKEIRHE